MADSDKTMRQAITGFCTRMGAAKKTAPRHHTSPASQIPRLSRLPPNQSRGHHTSNPLNRLMARDVPRDPVTRLPASSREMGRRRRRIRTRAIPRCDELGLFLTHAEGSWTRTFVMRGSRRLRRVVVEAGRSAITADGPGSHVCCACESDEI
ncbi:hypothetical protein BDV11DRAFT_189590 [Aspergillus similis]